MENLDSINLFGLNPTQITDILHFILTNNVFRFGNSMFRQKMGLAMGNRVAPIVAIIFMHCLETKIWTECGTARPACWYRYIDDIFCLWPHGIVPLMAFHNKINSIHPTIKFTVECSPTTLPFLNVRINLVDNVLETGWYRKPTKAPILLNYHSAHPASQKISLIGSQLISVRRLCSTQSAFSSAQADLKHLFTVNGYPERVVDSQFSRFRQRWAGPAHPIGDGARSNRPPAIVIPFIGPQFQRKLNNILQRSGLDCRIIWRPGTSLKGVLVRSAFVKHVCPKRHCNARLAGAEGVCTKKYCVYRVDCLICHKFYVGETNRPLHVRFDEHFRAAKNKSNISAVGEHFEKFHPATDISQMPVETVLRVSVLATGNNFADRLYKEAILIKDLAPQINRDQGWAV